MLKTGEMLKMQACKGTQIFNMSPVLSTFGQKMFKTREMLKMLKVVFEKMLKTGEMLKMLMMLKLQGKVLGAQSLTFPLF